MTKWDVFAAVKSSALPPPARLVLVMLLDAADADTSRIPAEWTPSLTQLAGWTGLSRAAVAKQLNILESLGWVVRSRPTVAAARSKKERTRYALAVGRDPEPSEKAPRKPKSASPQGGLVQEVDQPASPGDGPDDWSTTSTSPPCGPELVHEVDQASPGDGPELVHEVDTIPPPTFTPQPPIARQGALGETEGQEGLFPPPAKPAVAETEGQRINRLARTYTDRLPLSSFMAVQSIVRTAVRTGAYTDDQITTGLSRLADDPGRPVTANSLRIAITGAARRPAYAGPPPVSTDFSDWKPQNAA